jgi:hypothetical protein
MNRLLGVVALLAGCGSSSSSWTQQDVPQGQFLTALTVWAAGENDVWLGGSSLWHYDGNGWTESPPPVQTGIADFWGFSPNDIWAIGDAHVLHWDGTHWSEIPPNNNVTFSAMWRLWGSTSSDIYIANQDNSRVYHYNGATWSVTTLQFVQADGLWGASANDIWLSGIGDLYHYTGGTWNRYQGNDGPPSANAFWGFSASDVWSAGSFDALSHWNGSTWTPEEDLDGSYNGIWGAATDDIWAVGDLGQAAHYDGDRWSVSQELSVRQNFTMVHGSSPDNVWATGVDLGAQKALVLKKD